MHFKKGIGESKSYREDDGSLNPELSSKTILLNVRGVATKNI